MYIDNKELVELLEKQEEIKSKIKADVDKINELTQQVEEIREKNKPLTDELTTLRQNMTKIFLPEVLKKLSDVEMFEFPQLVDGKVFIKVTDITESAVEDAKKSLSQVKQDWQNHFDKLTADKPE